MLFKNPNLIFIHVPKTGGTTLSTFLQHTSNKLRKKLGDGAFTYDHSFHNHNTLQMYADRGIDISKYDIVTIARNPWERILSFYCHHYSITKPDVFTFPIWPAPIFKRGQPKYITFPDFYNNIEPSYRFIEDFMDFITIDGKLPDNLTILDFENFQEEIENYCNTHDIIISQSNRGFHHDRDNKIIPKEMRKYFLSDPAYLEKISEQYSKEIEYFGYKAPELKYTPNK